MSWRIQQWNQEKTKIVSQSEAILNRAKSENRELTAEEDRALSDNTVKLAELNAKIAKEEALVEYARTAQPVPFDDISTTPGDGGTTGPVGRGNAIQAKVGDLIFRNAATGAMVRAIRPSESFCAEPVHDGEPNAIGREILGWMTGNKQAYGLKASSQQGNIDTAGGYLFEPRMSQMFVDLARAASVCTRAGAMTIPMEAAELHLARATTDPTSYWRGEGLAVTASVRNFDRIVMRARTLACVVPITRELLEDAANAPSLIEQAISASMGLRLDQAALLGTGAESEPLGVRNCPTVNTVSGVGTPTDYSEVSSAVKKILQGNYNDDVANLAWIQNPRDAATYDGLQDTLHQPLRPTPWASKLQQLFTTSVSTVEGAGKNESFAVVGDFSQMLIGMRTSGIVLRRINDGAAADVAGITHNAVTELKEFIVAYLRADVAILRPTWFSVLSGITAAG